jgi:hypothetical protein
MVCQTLALGLMAAAASASAIPRQVVPNYPPTSESTGFRLVVNVTDPSTDFPTPVHNSYLNSIHVGAGIDLIGVSADSQRIFYQNGTAEEVHYSTSNVLSDAGTPPFPQGFSLDGDSDVKTAGLTVAGVASNVFLTRFPEPYSFLLPETFAVCDTYVEYYQQNMLIIRQTPSTVNENGDIVTNFPEGCVPVRLIPECAELATLPDDAIANHDFAANSQCYDSVSSIDWSQYGP